MNEPKQIRCFLNSLSFSTHRKAKETLRMHRQITPAVARRLAIAAQGLAAPRPAPTQENLLALLRRLRCLQLDPDPRRRADPVSGALEPAGAPMTASTSTILVYGQRQLFEYWAHCASHCADGGLPHPRVHDAQLWPEWLGRDPRG
jgi:uncharacterized protein YcaQ